MERTGRSEYRWACALALLAIVALGMSGRSAQGKDGDSAQLPPDQEALAKAIEERVTQAVHLELADMLTLLTEPPPEFSKIKLKNMSSKTAHVNVNGFKTKAGHLSIEMTIDIFGSNFVKLAPNQTVELEYLAPLPRGVAYLSANVKFQGNVDRFVAIGATRYMVFGQQKFGGFHDVPTILLEGNGTDTPLKATITGNETWNDSAQNGDGNTGESPSDSDNS